jgi:hypothetical protein
LVSIFAVKGEPFAFYDPLPLPIDIRDFKVRKFAGIIVRRTAAERIE